MCARARESANELKIGGVASARCVNSLNYSTHRAYVCARELDEPIPKLPNSFRPSARVCVRARSRATLLAQVRACVRSRAIWGRCANSTHGCARTRENPCSGGPGGQFVEQYAHTGARARKWPILAIPKRIYAQVRAHMRPRARNWSKAASQTPAQAGMVKISP
jgi:hypothetical protein